MISTEFTKLGEFQKYYQNHFDLLFSLYKGSYVNAHVLYDILNKLRERDQMLSLSNKFRLIATSLIN